MAKKINMKIAGHEILDQEVFAVSQVKFRKNGKALEGNATGFFYEKDNKLYFITNRHVIIDESKCFIPDELRLLLHKKDGKSKEFPIRLYDEVDGERKPLWLEHPEYKKDVDVVALCINKNQVKEEFDIYAFDKDDLPGSRYISIGDDLLVIGYPLGTYDTTHNTPIIRNATMASVYPLHYKGNCCFLIDSRLHDGTSGSPVLLKSYLYNRRSPGRTRYSGESPFKRYLIGIHSAQLEDYEGIHMNLNNIWYSYLIPEIIGSNKRLS